MYSKEYFVEKFREQDNDALVSRLASNDLTDEAKCAIRIILHERGMDDVFIDSALLKAAELRTAEGVARGESGYRNYAEVPFYRRQWFFWLMFFLFQPVAIALLTFGDIYYTSGGKVKNFGLANRVVAWILGVVFMYRMVSIYVGRPQ